MPVEVKYKDNQHGWDNESGFSYQHQTSTGPSANGPSGPTGYSNNNNNKNNNDQRQKDKIFEQELEKQFEQSHQEATAPRGSYMLYTRHSEYPTAPSHYSHQNNNDAQNHHHYDAQESHHPPPQYHSPHNSHSSQHNSQSSHRNSHSNHNSYPNHNSHSHHNSNAQEEHNARVREAAMEALMEASHQEFVRTHPPMHFHHSNQPQQFAGGRQFTSSINVPEEMMQQASISKPVVVTPPAEITPSYPVAPRQPVQLIKIDQPMIPRQ